MTPPGHPAADQAPSAAEATSDAAVHDATKDSTTAQRAAHPAGARAKEIGGREGPDPTRYGDWEMRGRCIDF
jgi:hypothetical protein